MLGRPRDHRDMVCLYIDFRPRHAIMWMVINPEHRTGKEPTPKAVGVKYSGTYRGKAIKKTVFS